MKSLNLLIGIYILAAFTSAHARNSRLENASPQFCPGLRYIEKTNSLVCKSENSQQVKEAKVGGNVSSEELRKLRINLSSAVDAGIVPDADSDTVYFYTRWLVNSNGGKVGLMTIEGWVNQEMGQSARFIVRYNLKGQVVTVSEKSLR